LVRRAGDERAEAYLLGILSSLPLDWYARRFIELNVNFHILNGFPIPKFEISPLAERVVRIAGVLAASDDRFSEWSAAVGVAVGQVTDDNERLDLISELDAVVAHLYGLNRSQLMHIFETFHRGWDYQGRLDQTLRHFDVWMNRS
jgi:hypothetical protein